jgi:hypothetical protein
MPRFENPIEYPFAGEAAAALGYAGRQLQKTLDALRKYDSHVSAGRRRADPAVRADLMRRQAKPSGDTLSKENCSA